MNSPAQALCWEIWRVTRIEAGTKFVLGLTAAVVVWASFSAPPPAGMPGDAHGFGAALTLVCIVLPYFLGWLFLSRHNGNQPGFPLPLLFARPVRTAALVGVPLLYLTLLPAAAYLVSALLMRAITGLPFPLWSVALWLALMNLVVVTASWSCRRLSTATLLTGVFSACWMIVVTGRLTSNPDGSDWHDSPENWQTLFSFRAGDLAVIASVALVAYGITVAKVSRQRRGDSAAARFWVPGMGYPEQLVDLFRFNCPPSSALRAQVWFDLRSRGLPVLTIGAVLAIAIPLLFSLGGYIDDLISTHLRVFVGCSDRGCFYARPMTGLFAGISFVFMLFQGGNAFGIRWKRGRVYLSDFDATLPSGAARLALLKLLVRAGCFLAAVLAVGASLWMSLPLLGDGVFLQVFGVTISGFQQAINDALAALTGIEKISLLVLACVGSLAWSSAFAALGALWLRYPRRGNIVASVLLGLGVALAALSLAGSYGFVPASFVDAVLNAARWTAAASLLLITGHVLWRGLTERVLTKSLVGLMLMATALFVAAVVIASAIVPRLSGIPASGAHANLWAALVPLTALLLAPWALSRLRQM